MDRRDFIRETAAASAALALAPRAQAADRSTVVLVHLPGAAALRGDERVAAVEKMVAAGMAKLTGKSGAAAWSSLFKPGDVVALKVNCLCGPISTSVALADVVARGVMSAGVKGENTLVWERSKRELSAGGYSYGLQPAGYQIIATDDKSLGISADTFAYGKVTQKVSKMVTERATALINLPIVKDHNIAGVTGALKNHYGTISKPWECHAGKGDPFVADVAALKPIRERERLVICDALTMVFEGGPMNRPDWRFVKDTLLFATDPVAHDVLAWKMIEEVRALKGLKPLAKVGRQPTYLQTAASETHKLGIYDEAAIDVERVELT